MRYRAKSNVVFGGISLADYNAFAYWTNIHERPVRDVKTVEIPGRSGDLLFDNGRYTNVARDYVVQVIGTDNCKNLLAALVKNTGYQRLEDEYDPDVYVIARLSKTPSIMHWVGEASAIRVSFDRKPQRYLKSGEENITVSNGAKLYNTTLYDARPLVRVYGTGTLGIGSNSIKINQVNSYVDIDCELQDAYKEGTNCNGDIQLLSGDFFKLIPGNNGVSITGSINQVIVTPRWWTI